MFKTRDHSDKQQNHHFKNLLLSVKNNNYNKVGRTIKHNLYLFKRCLDTTHFERALNLAIEENKFLTVCNILKNIKITEKKLEEKIISYFVKILLSKIILLNETGTITQYYRYFSGEIKTGETYVSDARGYIHNILCCEYVDKYLNHIISTIRLHSGYCRKLNCECDTCKNIYSVILSLTKEFLMHDAIATLMVETFELKNKLLELEPVNKSFMVFMFYSFGDMYMATEEMIKRTPVKTINIQEKINKIKNFGDVIIQQ